jgi:carbon-monoxide dehydrogenase small subunit
MKTARPEAVRVVVNRRRLKIVSPPFRRLLDVLRDDLGLTGTKEGCGEGECGACAVLLDGQPVNSCLVPLCQVEDRSVRTVESLGRPGALNRLQQAFQRTGAAQCGICTPGMLMTATAWVEQGGSDDPDAIRTWLAGNLCRCTGYQHIVNGVIEAVRERDRRRVPRRPRAAGRRVGRRTTGRGGR